MFCVWPACTSAQGLNNDNTWTNNNRFKGVIPWADVTAFGARPMGSTVYPHTTTASPGCRASNNMVNLATDGHVSSATFQNGDGITLYGCGTGISLLTPSAPTVTPSAAAGGTELGGGTTTGIVVNSGTGSSKYVYKLVARTQFGGYTAASPATTIINGVATLVTCPQSPHTS